MALELRGACERCGAELAPDGMATICSHECTFCPTCASRARARLPELRRRARRAGHAAPRERRQPPLRPPAVLRLALRLLRLRHRRRPPTASTAGYVDALLRELELERDLLARAARDGLPRRRHAHADGACRARAAARRAAVARRADDRGEPRDGDARAGGAPPPRRRRPGLARRADVPGPSAPHARPRGHPRTTSGARSASCARRVRQPLARPDLRHPRPGAAPTSLAISARPSRSPPSTCPRTSWRPSRERASRMPTARSWNASPSRWSRTSSSSSRRSPVPATAGTRPRTSAATEAPAATCARGTTSATGSATTTSGSASAPSARSTVVRWRNAPSLGRYLAALELRRTAAPRGRGAVRRGPADRAPDARPAARPAARRSTASKRSSTRAKWSGSRGSGSSFRERGTLSLTDRGRFLGGGVTAAPARLTTLRAAPTMRG